MRKVRVLERDARGKLNTSHWGSMLAPVATVAGGRSASPRQSSKRFTATTALVPPNANALLMAARIGRSRA